MWGNPVGQRDYAAEDAEERALLAKRNRAMQLNPEWYESSDQMMEDVQGRKDAAPGERKAAIQERTQAQQANRRIQQGGFATGNPMFNPMAVAQHAGMMNVAQGNSLQNAINQTSNAWRDEHDSRVSQNREARRMEHEKEVERMRIDALMQRLAMEQRQQSGPRPKASGQGFAIY
jgi:hypothetical protein